MNTILKIKNLSCGYGRNEIIHDISFSVEEGEFIGIIGPNGAGKTTLFRAITKLLDIAAGEIFYCAKNIHSLSTKEIARGIAVLPQGIELNFSFTVEEFVLMGRYPHKKRFERLNADDYGIVRNALALTDTEEISRQRINELSGGEKQRVLLAQALAQQPKLLLLDEPTSHLDIGHQVNIMDLLRDLNRRYRITILVVLHDLNLAAEYADRLILLNRGRIFKSGNPYEVLTYQNIEEVYQTVVVVRENPLSHKPYILLATHSTSEVEQKLNSKPVPPRRWNRVKETKEGDYEKRAGVDLHRHG